MKIYLILLTLSVFNLTASVKKNPLSLTWSKNIDPLANTGNLPIALHWPIIGKGKVFATVDGKGLHAYDKKREDYYGKVMIKNSITLLPLFIKIR